MANSFAFLRYIVHYFTISILTVAKADVKKQYIFHNKKWLCQCQSQFAPDTENLYKKDK